MGQSRRVLSGGIVRLFRRLKQHPKAVEADLSRFDHLDIRDRDRFDEYGRRKVTLEMIAARMRYRPEGSAISIAENDGIRPFTRLERFIGGDLFTAITGEANPRFDIARARSPVVEPDSDREALKKKRSREAAERRAKRDAQSS
ncbi:hypothetical protein [Rhodococcoides fascians]|uniref:hypothetical protein n=1 Tax=Rhodococcoides fascians TaxID=1828 RepID=UPI00068D9200|nr:hypothetical protein [Rhodococcus fascians]